MSERTREIARFSDKAGGALKEHGLIIYTLTGDTVSGALSDGRIIRNQLRDVYDFEFSPSRLSEVAINPKVLGLHNSNNKTLTEQELMVAGYSEMLQARSGIPGIKAIIGQVPDYVELVFAHLDATGERLFGQRTEKGYFSARTITRSIRAMRGNTPWVADVGKFFPNFGLEISEWNQDEGRESLYAVPLIVPNVTLHYADETALFLGEVRNLVNRLPK